MPNCQAPVEHRFSSTNQPKHRPPRGVSVATELKKILSKQIEFEDVETKQMAKGKISHVIALRLVLNACQGENEAIKEILNRIDGKQAGINLDQSQHTEVKQTFVYLDSKALQEENGTNRIKAELSAK